MKQKHSLFIIGIFILSLIHLIFSFYYVRLYGYFNVEGNVTTFVLLTRIGRFLLDALIVLAGYLAMREGKQRFLPFYLLFFLMNLILPFLFQLS
ncbi:MAG: hypothetical protein ACK5NA_05365 [Enterococcus sp.]